MRISFACAFTRKNLHVPLRERICMCLYEKEFACAFTRISFACAFTRMNLHVPLREHHLHVPLREYHLHVPLRERICMCLYEKEFACAFT